MLDNPIIPSTSSALAGAGARVTLDALQSHLPATSGVRDPSAASLERCVARLVADLERSPRPRPKGGTQSKDVQELRRVLFEDVPSLNSGRNPALAGYAKNICSVLALLGYTAPLIKMVPNLSEAIGHIIRSDYKSLEALGIPASAIRRRGHLFTLGDIRALVTRAKDLFDGAGKRSNARAMTDLVMRGVYPNIDTLHAKYLLIMEQARGVFGAGKETASVVGTVVSLVLRKERESVEECLNIYSQALQDGKRLSTSDNEFAPLLRTMAGLVLSGRYPSMAAAYRRYNDYRQDIDEQASAYGFPESLVRTTAVLLIKGAYKNASLAMREWKAVQFAVAKEAKKNPELDAVAGTLELLVYCKTYRSVAAAVSRYQRELGRAVGYFSIDEDGRCFARTAALLVLQRRFPSVTVVYRRQRQLIKEGQGLCANCENGTEVTKTLVLVVLKGYYPSIAKAHSAYMAALSSCEYEFKAHPSLARTAALLVLLKRFESGRAAFDHFSKCQSTARSELAGDKLCSPLIELFAERLFRGAIPSVAEGKKRYLKAYADCRRAFGSHPDSRLIIRTAALLVFRGVYQTADQALSEYLAHLEYARARLGHSNEPGGGDLRGVRALAIRRFERRDATE